MKHTHFLVEEPEIYRKKFSIFQEISNAIVALDNISAIANLMLDIAVNYTNAEKGSVMLLNDKRELNIFASKGIDLELARNYKMKMGEGIAGTVAKQRIPVLVEDIDKDRRFKGKKRDRYRTRSFISCPIISRKRLLGILNINDKKDNSPFTEDEFDLIKIIANQAAITLENAYLMNQLKSKAVELEEINIKLIDSDVTKTEFLTRVSHELRTPLNSIKGAIYYLRQTEDISKEEQKEFYSIIADETGSLITIIENLLDFIRLEDEMKVISRTVINIADLLIETLEAKLIQSKLKKRNLQLTLNISDDISDIVGDRIKIVQFFLNLIEGLSHYLEDGDTIGISVRENDVLEIVVDLSRKMPEVVLTYLLHAKRLFNTDQPEEIVKLYLARKVAEVHYWDIAVTNQDTSCAVSIKIAKSQNQKIEAAIAISMDMFVEYISDTLDIDICSIMLADDHTGELTIKSSRGLSDDIVRRTRIRPGDKIAGWVAVEGKPLMIDNIERDPRFGKKNIPQYSTKSLISLPLKLHDKVVGVLNLNNKKGAEEFTKRDFHIASIISERISHFIDKFTSGTYTEFDFKQFMKSFDDLIVIEKKYQKKHAALADLIAGILAELDASEEDKKMASYISLVYDFGLMLIDEKVLQKKALSPSEARSLQSHPSNSVHLLDSLEFSDTIRKAILHHHERYDGTGYPNELKGEEIPFLSRVIAVADSFFAMTNDRPYRKKISREKALAEIQKGAGSLYDPAVTKALATLMQKGKTPH